MFDFILQVANAKSVKIQNKWEHFEVAPKIMIIRLLIKKYGDFAMKKANNFYLCVVADPVHKY